MVIQPLVLYSLDSDELFSWTRRKKMIATMMVSALTFLTPLSSTMIAPSSLQIAEEFNITSGALINMITSIFVLAYGDTSFRYGCSFFF